MHPDGHAVLGKVVGGSKLVPEQERLDVLLEFVPLGLGVRLVALQRDHLVDVQLELAPALGRLVARAPAGRRRPVEGGEVSRNQDSLRHLRQVLLVRVECLQELLHLLDGTRVMRGEVEARELHLVFRPVLLLGQGTGGKHRILGEHRPVELRHPQIRARDADHLSRFDRPAVLAVLLVRVEARHLSVAQRLDLGAVLGRHVEIEVRPGGQLARRAFAVL